VGVISASSSGFDILFVPIVEREWIFCERGELPVITRLRETFSAAALHTLTAKQTAIQMIPHHEAFFRFVHRDDLNCLGRAVFDAKPTTSAIRGIPVKLAA
jgi:hypothetical protein